MATNTTATATTHTGNGSTNNFAISFSFLANNEVDVTVAGVLKTLDTHYTISGSTVTFTSGNTPANGAAIKFQRDTNISAKKVDFQDGSVLTETDLDTNSDQVLFAQQEITDKLATVEEGATADQTVSEIKTLIAGSPLDASHLAANSVDSSELVDGSVDTSHLADDAVTAAKIANSAVTSDAINSSAVGTFAIGDNAVLTAKIANSQVTEAKLADPAVSTNKIHDLAVTAAKIANETITSGKLASNSVTTPKIQDGSILTAKIANSQVDESKLADPAVSTNKIHDSAVTTAKIANSAINTAKIANGAVTNGKLAADAVDGTKIADDSINSEHYVDGSIDTAHIANDAVTTGKIADAELKTLAGMQSATASKLADSTALTSDIADLNQIDGMAKQTTITDDDTKFPTSGAVVDYVAAQLAPIGGLEVIATDAAFPNTQPAAGVVISIADAGGLVVDANGTSTTARTVGGTTVTINNFASNFNSSTVDAGVAIMVSSTGTNQVYNYHKATLKEADLLSLSNDINDFAARYRVTTGEPTSNNDEGDLIYDKNADKMKVFDSTTNAFKEVTSVGDFKFLFLCPTGGSGSPTINGSIATYDLREGSTSGAAASVTSAAQLLVSINGVVQKPNTGTSAPSEGFAMVDSNTIIFGSNLPTGAEVFVIQIGSAISLQVPADNTVATAKLQNGSVTTAKIVDDAVTTAKIANNAITTAQINNSEVTNAKLAANAVTADKINNSEISTAKIQDGAVTTAKIADDAVTSAKIADGAVVNARLGDDSVTSAKIDAGAVDATALASNAVTTAKINAGAVTNAKLGDDSITAAKIDDGAVGTAALATDAVTQAKIADGAIDSARLASDAVTTAKLADGNISTAKLANSSVTAAKIANSAVTGAKLDNDAVSTAKIGDGQVTAAKLASGVGGKCIKQLATFTSSAFNTTDSAFSDVISVNYTPASSSSLIVFDFTAANSTIGNSSGGSATLGIRLKKDSTTLINATNATDFAVGNGEPDRISAALLVRHMEGNSNTNQRTYKVQFNREAGNSSASLSNGLGIIIREYA